MDVDGCGFGMGWNGGMDGWTRQDEKWMQMEDGASVNTEQCRS